jgi:hypothetical protein
MSLNLDSLVKSDSKESSSNKEGTEANSIANEIATLRAQLFKKGTQEYASKGHEDKRDSTAITASTKGSRKAKPCVPSAKGGRNKAEVLKRGAVFGEGTHFNDKPGKPLKKTPGKATSSTLITSVIRIKIKLLHRITEMQGAIMALLDHCLINLQEKDKSAHLLSGDNSEEAFRANDLSKDFTDFYNKWGLWEERTQAFLNTIPKGKSRAFLA